MDVNRVRIVCTSISVADQGSTPNFCSSEVQRELFSLGRKLVQARFKYRRQDISGLACLPYIVTGGDFFEIF